MVGHDAVFGQPSTYSLTPAELTAEVRRRRREGWQGWEIRARFDFGAFADAAQGVGAAGMARDGPDGRVAHR
jgi:hypothetical protein